VLTAQKTLSTSVLQTSLLMMYKTELLFILRSTQNTQMQCNRHAEFFNVKVGGSFSNRQALKIKPTGVCSYLAGSASHQDTSYWREGLYCRTEQQMFEISLEVHVRIGIPFFPAYSGTPSIL